MQDQFCDKLTVLIEQAPDPQTSTELSKILSRCKAGQPQPEAGTFGDEAPEFDSGGGGNTNPPQPGGPTRPK